jgi:hypothetical protein
VEAQGSGHTSQNVICRPDLSPNLHSPPEIREFILNERPDPVRIPPEFVKELFRTLEEDERRNRETRFEAWCRGLEALPGDFEQKLKDGLKADLELQPFRWMHLGLDLLKSSKGTVTVQGFNGKPGPFLDSFLAYPVFQMGAEIFLKGMWLCQFADCRALGDRAYMDPGRRGQYMQRLKNELGHDLLQMLAANRQIPQYQADAGVLRFLKIVEGIVRQYYFPLYEADKRGPTGRIRVIRSASTTTPPRRASPIRSSPIRTSGPSCGCSSRWSTTSTSSGSCGPA